MLLTIGLIVGPRNSASNSEFGQNLLTNWCKTIILIALERCSQGQLKKGAHYTTSQLITALTYSDL